MADSNNDTPAPDGTQADHGSEFSRGTGTEDASIWDKHFGKGSKTESKGKDKAESDSKRPSSRSSRDASESASKSKASSGEKTPSSSTTSKSTTDSSEKSTKRSDASSKSDASSSSPAKDAKAGKGSTADTGGKTAKDDEPAEPSDPEDPHKKARDLYAQAKKTEDRREARKLYKRAMVEAFGEVPEEFDDKRYAAVRTERAAAKATLDKQRETNEGRIREAADKLKPAIYVMRSLEGAKLADKLTVPMVEKAIHVMRALRSIEDGDYTQLAEVVSRAAGVDHDEAMKRFVKGVKMSPEGKAARQAAEDARREAAETRSQLQQLQKQLQERDNTQTEAQKKQQHTERVQAQHQVLLEDIQTELDGHAVLGLPKGAERVKAYLIRTADPKLKAFKYSYAQVADKIVAGERRRLRDSRHLLEEGDEPASTPQRRQSNGSVSRAETRDASVPSQDSMARFDYFFDKHAGEQRQANGRRR